MFSCNVFRGVLSSLLGNSGGTSVLVCFGASAWCGQGTLPHSCVRLHFSFGVAGIFAPARIKNKSDERTLFYHRFCGQRWIRTTEGVSQQIYSLPHLATLVFAHISSRLWCVPLMSLGNGCKVRHYFFCSKLFPNFFQEKMHFSLNYPLFGLV